MSGFTALAERLARAGHSGAEVLVGTISRIFTPLLDVTCSYGGDVLKFGGDALLLFFDGADHLPRACAAADGMRRALRRVGTVQVGTRSVTLRMSQGLHSGTFDFFLVGSRHAELVVAGAAATTTVQMEAAAAAQEILLSASAAAELDERLTVAHDSGGRLLRLAPKVRVAQQESFAPAGEPQVLERFVPLAVRGRLDSIVSESEHRQATVAFLHFTGVDALLEEQGPEEVHRRLHALTNTVVEASAEFGVCILCTDVGPDGGKFMLASGVPEAQEDADERMLRAAHAVVQTDVGLPVRVGVNRGHVYGGAVGAPTRFTYSTMGDAVNLAARVMGKAAPRQLLATADVIARCAERFAVAPLPAFMVKGKSQPVQAFAVGEPIRGARRRSVDQPFVGRLEYVERYASAHARAWSGSGSVIELVGDPGVGKSRLLREATARLEAAFRVEVQCDHYESSTAYSSARALLTGALGLQEGVQADAVVSVVRQRVLAAAPAVEPWLPLLGDILDVRWPPTPEASSLAPRLRRQRLGEVVRKVLRAVLPVGSVVVIADSFWMDEASADLLVPLLDMVEQSGWLVCLSRRPESTGLHAGRGYAADVLTLSPLPRDHSLALLLIADDSLTPHTAEQLLERAAGNPLFLLQLGAATAAGADLEALPDDVAAMVASRIDRLLPEDRRLLRYCAVLGSRFLEQELKDAVGDLVGRDVHRDDWDRLAAFVHRDDDGALRFENELFRKVAYEALPFAARRRAHAAAGEVLEGAGAEDRLELLSLHFHHAQHYDKSWHYSRRAGDRALRMYANQEAVELYRRAGEAWRFVASANSDDLAHVCEAMGDALEVTAQYREASQTYRRARRLTAGDARREIRLMLKEGVVRERLGRYPAAVRWYRRGLRQVETLREAADGEVVAKLLVAMAATRFRQGRLEECVSWAERAASAAEAAGHRATQAHSYFLLDSALTDLGRSESQLYRLRALPIYEELGDLVGQANVLNNLGINAYYEGRWDEAVELYEQSRERRVRAGDVMGAATAANNIAEILSDQGHTAEAEVLFREAGRVFRCAGYSIGEALVRSNLGRTAGRAGRYDEAHQLLNEALSAFRTIGAGVFVIETQARMAELLLARDDVAGARALAEAVLPAAVGAEAAVARTMLERIRGLCLARQGRLSEGRSLLITSVQRAESAGAEFELSVSLHVLACIEESMELPRARERRAASTRVLERLEVHNLGCYAMCDGPLAPPGGSDRDCLSGAGHSAGPPDPSRRSIQEVG